MCYNVYGKYYGDVKSLNKILIIENENDINNMLRETFILAGYECTQAFSGTEGVLYARTEKFSLILLDLMLPGLSGEEALVKLKELQDTPVIVISAKSSLDSKVGLLTAGADDYMTKPFELQELLARAAVQIRRYSGSFAVRENAHSVTYKNAVLSRDSFKITVSGTEIDLTKQEFRILELLMTHPGKVFSKQDIYDYAWEDYYIGEDKTINVHISNIRRKIKSVTDEEYIETVWGIGFKMK